jgi:hypothetical protein
VLCSVGLGKSTGIRASLSGLESRSKPELRFGDRPCNLGREILAQFTNVTIKNSCFVMGSALR